MSRPTSPDGALQGLYQWEDGVRCTRPTAEDICAYLEQHPNLGLEVKRRAKVAGPWEGSRRNIYASAHASHWLAWAEPAWQSPKQLGAYEPRRWAWGVQEMGDGQFVMLGRGECDTQEEARAAADALLRSHGYGLADEAR